jgi:hypothetical protein
MWQEIRQKIIDVINANTTKLQCAYRTDRSKFDGYPAAVVSPSDNEADYEDSASDKLTFIFTVSIYQTISDVGEDQADIILEQAVDELLDLFLHRGILDNVAEWVEPVNSRWGYQDRPDGQLRVAELKIRCRKYLHN